MAVNKKTAVLKTALLAPGGTLLAWAVQKALLGEPITGVVSFLTGLFLIGAFVVLNERDIPYDGEIVPILAEQLENVSEKQIAEALKRNSEEVADSIQDEVDTGEQ